MFKENNIVNREFFRPDLATWWIFCLFVFIGGAGISIRLAKNFLAASYALKSLIPLFIFTLLIFISLVLIADPYRARRKFVLLIALVGGATIPTYMSFLGNNKIFFMASQILPDGVGIAWAPAIAGPTTEEWSKMLVIMLVMLIAYKTFIRPIHGFLAGAFVGLGFQLFENVSYAANTALSHANSNMVGAWTTTIFRSVIGVSSHWLYSAIVGVGVAILLGRSIKQRSLGKRILLFIFFYAIGYGCHFFWNSPLGLSTPFALFVIIGKVALWIVILYFVGKYVLKEERAFLREKEVELSDDLAAFNFTCEELSSSLLPRKERKKFYKEFKAKEGKEKLKDLKAEQADYLDMLQKIGIEENLSKLEKDSEEIAYV